MSLPTLKIHAWGWRLVIFAAIFTAIYCIKLWQPRRQVELHQKNFLLALEDRNWRQVQSQLSENYSDRFSHNRETVVQDLTEVLRQFFALEIRSQGTQLEISPQKATITSNITLAGTGTGATELITSEVNRLTSPWVFTWRKASLWPWDWQLEKVDNAVLKVGEWRSDF